MTDKELDELEALEKGCVKGPWRFDPEATPEENELLGPGDEYILAGASFFRQKAHGSLIVAARNALPWLIAALREAREEVASLQKLADELARKA